MVFLRLYCAGKCTAKEFIRKASHPHPCPLPSRERGLKNCPSLDGRGLRGGCLNVALLMVLLVTIASYRRKFAAASFIKTFP
jgi:hypothetical protein